MRSPSAGGDQDVPHGSETPRSGSPSVLDLVRLSPRAVFPPGGEELYRQIARLTELAAGMTVLDAACGRGVSTAFLARSYGVEAHGLDPDAALVEEAEERSRAEDLETVLHFQHAPLDDIPYKDEIFDVVIGEIGLGALTEPERAVRELVRVVRPRGAVVLVQLTWTGHLEDARKDRLIQHLGAHPLLLVEWKQILRDAGVVELHVEDWSDSSSPFRPTATPFHDLADFTLKQKLVILRRAMQRWGWRGVRGAIVREQEIHSLLTRQRVLGLSLIRGTRWKEQAA